MGCHGSIPQRAPVVPGSNTSSAGTQPDRQQHSKQGPATGKRQLVATPRWLQSVERLQRVPQSSSCVLTPTTPGQPTRVHSYHDGQGASDDFANVHAADFWFRRDGGGPSRHSPPSSVGSAWTDSDDSLSDSPIDAAYEPLTRSRASRIHATSHPGPHMGLWKDSMHSGVLRGSGRRPRPSSATQRLSTRNHGHRAPRQAKALAAGAPRNLAVLPPRPTGALRRRNEGRSALRATPGSGFTMTPRRRVATSQSKTNTQRVGHAVMLRIV